HRCRRCHRSSKASTSSTTTSTASVHRRYVMNSLAVGPTRSSRSRAERARERGLSSPAITPRRRVGLTVSGAWLAAALAIVATLTLPFGRPGRPFLTIDSDLYALNVTGPYSWLLLV